MPEKPPPDLEFTPSQDDETCPGCGWDREEASLDVQRAFNAGLLLAIEPAETGIYSSMAGTQLLAYYWHCPNCKDHFVTEEENSAMGAMS